MTTFSDLVARGVLAVGDGYRAKNEELGDEGPIFLRSAYLQDNGWVLDRPDRLARTPPGGFGPKVAQIDDAVLTTKGNSLGRLGLVNTRIAGSIYSPHLSYWRSLSPAELLPRYLYYWAHSTVARDQIKARSESTDMAPYLSLSDQLALQIELPPIGVQVDIIEVLGALDAKIELNARMAETLEAIARALFQSWFVDFDPVRAKAEGHPTDLPDDLAALFPSSLGEDGLPEGWRDQAGAIGELARSVVNPADVDPTTPYIGLEHLERRKLLIERCGLADHVDSSKTTFRVGDLLFGKLRPYFHKVAVAPSDGICSSDIFVFRPRSGVPRTFLYMSFSQADFVESASNASSGTRMPRADWSYMRRLPAVLPPSELLAAFDVIVSPHINAMLARAGQSRTLAALRDLLLPKLISGELRVADAEKRIAAA